MKTLIILAIITALLLWYALQGRDWLKAKPWAQPFFAWVEPIEIKLFKKSETILFARSLSLLGGVLTFLTYIGNINLSPIIPFVPEKYQTIVNVAVESLPLLISVIGGMVEWLRNRTTKPIELVAVAEKDITPQVARAMAFADATKDDAVAKVEEVKAA